MNKNNTEKKRNKYNQTRLVKNKTEWNKTEWNTTQHKTEHNKLKYIWGKKTKMKYIIQLLGWTTPQIAL